MRALFMGAVDETNNRYGRLLVTDRVEPDPTRTGARWHAICDCGKSAIVLGSNLRGGNTSSCGCYRREASSTRQIENGHKRIRHGHKRRSQQSSTYTSWLAMKQRCNNPNQHNWKNYGGRGITIDPRWDSFESFLADMGERPEGATIDRINPDGDYELDNCRWSTIAEQNNNQRRSR